MYSIKPSKTDAAITTFNNPHLVYPPTVTPLGKLVIMLPATGSSPANYTKFQQAMADAGYHTIGAMYVNEVVSGQQTCADLIPPAGDYMDLVCQEVFSGQDLSTLTSIDVTNSIENRLKKLFAYLIAHYPADNWGQFYDGTNIIWENIIVAGHSQGGDHAAFIGKYYPVLKVVCFSSPGEICDNCTTSWGILPIEKYRFFIHTNDNYAEHSGVIANMGVTEIPVNVYTDSNEADWQKYLTTSYPATVTAAHLITVIDNKTPLNIDGTPKFKNIWLHLLNN